MRQKKEKVTEGGLKMFDKFINRFEIVGELETVTAIHIGTAQKGMGIDANRQSFYKNTQGLPVIPGSSLKGAMRSFLERYLSSEFGRNLFPGENICTPENPCIQEKIPESEKPKSDREWGEYLFDKEKGKLCIICRLFGTKESGAKLQIRDARVLEETFGNAYEIRSGNSIDRDLGISTGGFKYEVEIVPEGTRFIFKMILENIDKTEEACVKFLLKALENGMILIGGMKTRGLGEMRLINMKCQGIDKDSIKDFFIYGRMKEFNQNDIWIKEEQDVS